MSSEQLIKENRAIAIGMLQEQVTPNVGYITRRYLEALLANEKNPEIASALKIALECVKKQEKF